jgi:hypothetical protein
MKKLILSTFMMMAACVAFCQPANDEPCGAIDIPVISGDTCLPSTPYSWINATSSATAPLPACQWTATKKDVWFKFIAPANGAATISTAPGNVGTDFTLAIYAAATCSSSFVYLNCDDDGGPGSMPYLRQTGLIPGRTYYIRFWGYSATQADGNVVICIFSEPFSTAKVGVGTGSPTASLDINGGLRIRGGNPGASKLLTSDSDGNASWQDPVISVPEAFIAMTPLSGSNTLLVDNGTKLVIPFQTNVQPSQTVDNANFNNSTHIYSAPEAGVYHFEVNINAYFFGATAATTGSIDVVLETSPVNNGNFFYRYLRRSVYLKAGDYIPYDYLISGDLKLAEGEQARITVFQNVVSQFGIGTGSSRFSALKIY